MRENYKKVLDLCKIMIERDYAPCGLEAGIKKRLLELTQELERRGRTGFAILFKDIFRAVNQAESNEKRFGIKTKCEYLKRGLEIPFDNPGGLGYWALRMTEEMRRE
jgi:hypothetical protein